MNNNQIVEVLRLALKEGRLTGGIGFDDDIEISLIEAIKKIRISSEKYKWHDLKANSNDLPIQQVVNICYETKLGYNYSSAIYVGYKWILEDDDKLMCNEVRAWKYIEQFEEV